MRGRAVVVLSLAIALTAFKQTPARVRYVVRIDDAAQRIFHVSATVFNLHSDTLDVTLPVWTPGWYALEYYAKNTSHFTTTGSRGAALASRLVDAQRWRISTAGQRAVTVSFDYAGTKAAVNQAFFGPDFAFFTGAQLFVQAEGLRGAPAEVRFELPAGWRIASALNPTADPAVYTAPDYDTLVDSPTWLGTFQTYEFSVAGKPHTVVFDASVKPANGALERMAADTTRLVQTQAALFGGLPYQRYWEFFVPGGGGDALEHGNSDVVDDALSGKVSSPGMMAGHEHFHVWNVKRLRPRELWPYDYQRPQATRSLWFSEGATDYYSALTAYRAGFASEDAFLRWLARRIESLEASAERRFISIADSSVATWRAYLHEPVSYYVGGSVLSALLDLSLRHETGGARGLDALMRSMYDQYYRHGQGFAPDDLVRAADDVGGTRHADFFRRFVDGTESPDYDAFLGFAGLRYVTRQRTVGSFGAEGQDVPQGRQFTLVHPGSAADRAGFRAGDILVGADGVRGVPWGTGSQSEWFMARPNARLVLSVLRAEQVMDIPVVVGTRQLTEHAIEPVPAPTRAQLDVRAAWLRRDP